VAFIRGTTADLTGNITMEHEALTLDNLALAMAGKNSKGFVIAQVERIAAPGVPNPRQVIVPGVMVDCVVQARAENQSADLRHGLQPGVCWRVQGAARHTDLYAARRA
jgi:propionate CoA-transferase